MTRETNARWAALRRAGVRLGLAYTFLFLSFFLLGFASPLALLPGGYEIAVAYFAARAATTWWFATHVFGREEPFPEMNGGSGDTTADWYALAIVVLLSVAVTAIWCAVDRGGRDRRTYAIMRVAWRYALAAAMVTYGMMKLFGEGQFPTPSGAALLRTYGESSPMGLAWTFLGYSQVYESFAGMGELVGGTLLLWRRTTLLGALVLVPVVTNVALVNLCFDVPVKMGSLHFFAMAIAIVLHDARRLWGAIVLQKATPAASFATPSGSVRMRRAKSAAKLAAFFAIFAAPVYVAAQTDEMAHEPGPFHRSYEVVRFVADGVEQRACADEDERWRWASFAFDQYLKIRRMDNTRVMFMLEIDRDASVLTLAPMEGDGSPEQLSYTTTPDDGLVLQGVLAGKSVEIELRPLRDDEHLLMNRGFRWVSDAPFNR